MSEPIAVPVPARAPDGPPTLYPRQPPALVITTQLSMVVGYFDHGPERYGLRILVQLGSGSILESRDEEKLDRLWREAEARAIARVLAALRLTWWLLLAADRRAIEVHEGADIACVTPPGGAFMLAKSELVQDVTP